MPNYFVQLQQPEVRNAMLDFAPVNNALNGVRQQNNENRNALLQQSQLDMRKEEQTYQRGRDAKQDQRLDEKYFADGAQSVMNLPATDPRRAAVWQNLLKRHPNASGLTPDYLDPVKGPEMVLAEYGALADPRDSQIKDLAIKKTQAEIQNLNQRGDGDFTKRAAAAQAFGLDPNSDAGRSYILTGKLPREDQQMLTATDKKAILEADEMVQVNQGAISALNEAMKLSPQANQGWGAGTRAALSNNLPDWMVPDAVSSPESGNATTNLDNAVIGTALAQLKSVFGGNPTEGERKILLELQGSSGQPDSVRRDIYQRAIALAQKRMVFNQQRADQLRGGTFYKPQGEGAQPAPGGLGGAPIRARNSAGDVIEWNGSAWVPAQ